MNRPACPFWLALLGLGPMVMSCDHPAPGAATTSSTATASSSLPASATSIVPSSATGSAVPAPPATPPTSFDGPPAAELAWEAEPISWPRWKLVMRSAKGWKADTVQGYPVLRAPNREGYVALFGDVGAMPPRTHLDMRLKWLESAGVDWSPSVDAKLGAEHWRTEQREGPGKVGETRDGVTKVFDATFWAVYFEPPGRTAGLLVVASVRQDAAARKAEIVGMIQSVTAK